MYNVELVWLIMHRHKPLYNGWLVLKLRRLRSKMREAGLPIVVAGSAYRRVHFSLYYLQYRVYPLSHHLALKGIAIMLYMHRLCVYLTTMRGTLTQLKKD